MSHVTFTFVDYTKLYVEWKMSVNVNFHKLEIMIKFISLIATLKLYLTVLTGQNSTAFFSPFLESCASSPTM